MKLKFITEKVQSKLLLWYMFIAMIYFNVNIAFLPYRYIKPVTTLEWAVSIMTGIAIMAIIILLAVSVFVIDSVKNIDFNDEK